MVQSKTNYLNKTTFRLYFFAVFCDFRNMNTYMSLFLTNCLMLPCHFTFPTPLPSYSSLALFRNLFCPSSITSESTSSMSVSRCRRGRQTDVVDVDFGGVSVSFWRLCCRSRVLFVSLHDETKMSNIISR